MLLALQLVRRHLAPTPLTEAPALGRRLGRPVQVKCENRAPTRSFKVRGALAGLSQPEAVRGAVTASTGNHGAAMAYAGRQLGRPVHVVVPVNAPENKVALIRSLGGEVVVEGADVDASADRGRELADHLGLPYLQDGEDPAFMAGAATLAWEVFHELPEAETIVVPVGGGNLLAAVALVATILAPRCRVIGVQSEQAPAVAHSFRAGHPVTAPIGTVASGLATGRPADLAFAVIRSTVHDVLTVPDDAFFPAMSTALEAVGEMAEPSGAAPFAALDQLPPGTGPVVLVLSGGNVRRSELLAALDG
ncbi:MAG TPA: pyridoxal-phosphate dependent enzyme [Candidatus Dormibacteraeota bacterium]|nr:pyridoxal-phosphate dependent enzyme [Candidatus Dormibacteraeota bacterium]